MTGRRLGGGSVTGRGVIVALAGIYTLVSIGLRMGSLLLLSTQLLYCTHSCTIPAQGGWQQVLRSNIFFMFARR